mgnify:CR=1 FL=1
MHTKSASGMFFVTFNNSCKSAGHYNCGYVFLTVGAGYFSCKNAARLPCGSGLRFCMMLPGTDAPARNESLLIILDYKIICSKSNP